MTKMTNGKQQQPNISINNFLKFQSKFSKYLEFSHFFPPKYSGSNWLRMYRHSKQQLMIKTQEQTNVFNSPTIQFIHKIISQNINKMMMNSVRLVVVLCTIAFTICQDYKNQSTWGGDCLTGKRQSPININTERLIPCTPDYSFELRFNDSQYNQTAYNKSNINLMTSYNLSQIIVTKKGNIKVYQALQFHFHHESEHHIDGKGYDMELHAVHTAQDKSFAVYAMLFKAERGDFLDPFDFWNLDSEQAVMQKFPIHLQTPKSAYHYKGSLTIPNCTEGFDWFLNPDPISIKESSLEKMAKLINGGENNNRKLQDLNDRKIHQYGSVCHHQTAKEQHFYRHHLLAYE